MKVLAISFILIPFLSFSQEIFSVDQLKEDFKVFQGSLEDFHPGLYWYNTREEMEGFFNQSEESIDNPMSSDEYLRLVAKTAEKIGCSHTWVRPDKDKEGLLFPLKLFFREKKAYFIKDYFRKSVAILQGAEITSINDIKIDSLIDTLLEIIPNDGNRKKPKYFMLNNYFQYLLRDYISMPQQFEISFLGQNGIHHKIEITGLTYDEIVENSKAKSNTHVDPNNILLTKIDSTTALLTIKQFADWNDGDKRYWFEVQLQKAFESLDSMKINHLALDLRGNGGGKVPWLVYSYFSKEPFRFAKKADFIFNKKSSYYQYQELHPAMKWIKMRWLNRWLPGSNKMKRTDESSWELTGLFMTKDYQPSSTYFEGGVYLLIDGGTSSAASDFAALMKSNQDATIFGEESGGGYYGNTSMENSYVTLPNTKIRIDIPLVRHQLNVKDNVELGRGVIPDFFISRTVEDEIKNIDTELQYVLKHLKQKNLPK